MYATRKKGRKIQGFWCVLLICFSNKASNAPYIIQLKLLQCKCKPAVNATPPLIWKLLPVVSFKVLNSDYWELSHKQLQIIRLYSGSYKLLGIVIQIDI